MSVIVTAAPPGFDCGGDRPRLPVSGSRELGRQPSPTGTRNAQFTPGSRNTLRTRPPLPPSDREYTPARSADRHRPEAHWRNPSIMSPAVTATGTTFCAAIVVRSRLVAERRTAAHPHAVWRINRAAVAKRGPEIALPTRSGPGNMFRFEAIRLSSGVRHRRNHLGHHHHHHHRSHGAWPHLRSGTVRPVASRACR